MNTRRPDSAAPLTQARRIVVKVGSALLVDGETGRVNRAWLETLVEDLLRLRKRGQRVILVSSGAIALGRRRLGLKHGVLRLEESQAAAAVGQIRLAHAYKELLEGCDVTVAQVLLTLEDSERRRRYLNARATLESLLALGALPVINENDTVCTGTPCGASKRVRTAPGSFRARRRPPRASSGSPARCAPPAPSPSMRERSERCSKAAASCPRASPRRADASTAATPSAYSPLT